MDKEDSVETEGMKLKKKLVFNIEKESKIMMENIREEKIKAIYSQL